MSLDLTTIQKEQLQKRWYELPEINKSKFRRAAEFAVNKVRKNLKHFTYAFPALTAPNGKYSKISNDPWTTGFWPGMIWISYLMTREKKFREVGEIQSILFKERMETNHQLQHHDIGFLYSLSCVANYKITGDKTAFETGIDAAEKLCEMYREVPGIIQRGGDMNNLDDAMTGVFIVDCMNNVPLLFWASKETGEHRFFEIAYNHMKNSLASIIKENGRVVQHGIANVITGEIISDSSLSQGKGGDDAAWARGQAWAIAGLPITYGYTGDRSFLEAAKAVIFYFLNRMPGDLVSNWDLYYTNDDEQRDTSASSIAVCGMLCLCSYLSDDDPDKRVIYNAALNILKSLSDNYLTDEKSMGILDAGVYGMNWKGVDEPNVWGDYYFMEALFRLTDEFVSFW
ncbi:MAG: glycoside hydrolase family 88 protein [Clostridia bacterium]|nr:glycoside hydrolase family 88 protein [Clostridia bacterium]